jgi:hypothetical protein
VPHGDALLFLLVQHVSEASRGMILVRLALRKTCFSETIQEREVSWLEGGNSGYFTNSSWFFWGAKYNALMKKVDLRKIQILKIIVEEYIKTGDIVGSKSLLKKHEMGVSSATIRNDMASLEKMGLIFQPYNSAGRLPTPRGIRVFVDYLIEFMLPQFIEAENELVERQERERVDDRLYSLVASLTKTTKEITF